MKCIKIKVELQELVLHATEIYAALALYLTILDEFPHPEPSFIT